MALNGKETDESAEEDSIRCEAVQASGQLHPNSGGGCGQRRIEPASEHSTRSAWRLGHSDGKEHHDEANY